MSIFGAPWADLTLEHVEAYLDHADDEPLLWETKGTKLDANEVRRQVCAFANSHEGGYLILGARPNPDTLGEPPAWVATRGRGIPRRANHVDHQCDQ